MLRNVLLFPLTMLVASSVYAATLDVDDQGQLLGARNVKVANSFYDVEFLDGTCRELFATGSACYSGTQFTFNTIETATVAAQSLVDQVFLDVELGLFRSDPMLTRGCSLEGNCRVRVVFDTWNTGTRAVSASIGSDGTYLDNISYDMDLTYNGGFTYSRWTEVAPVPLPASIFLLSGCFLGLFGASRYRSKITNL